MTAATMEEIVYPDGRHELTPDTDASLDGSPLHNLDLAPVPLRWELGTPNLGGPLATGGGLVFLGATMDHYLRAFDAETGAELWRGRLPAPGNATPMTYEAEGRQYVVIAAGGHARSGGQVSDALVAFALP